MAEYEVVMFWVEITTHELGIEGFREMGERFPQNFTYFSDWAGVCSADAAGSESYS